LLCQSKLIYVPENYFTQDRISAKRLDCTQSAFYDFFKSDLANVSDYIMVSNDYSEVQFFHPFEEFIENPLPPTTEAYMLYRDKAMRFVQARNERIDVWQKKRIQD